MHNEAEKRVGKMLKNEGVAGFVGKMLCRFQARSDEKNPVNRAFL
ncbi:hypothetical protein BN137_4184 [Cronobacter condimenti 1330]|uniref:Uncharacterized protein n=1 Tax=Cronobacter condimenti 1330 TaxID=1073999 RepID=K8A3X3_9ENTR|nr:hypothetical protein BN137_4184 [Cronobacter condimenti 1330]